MIAGLGFEEDDRYLVGDAGGYHVDAYGALSKR